MPAVMWRLAALVLPAAALSGCGSDIEFEDFGTTSAGNLVRKADDFCSLTVESGEYRMNLIASFDRTERTISFNAPDLHVPSGTEQADFRLLMAMPVGEPMDFTPEEVRFLQDGLTKIVSLEATDEMLFFLGMANQLAFGFDGEVLGDFTKPGGFEEELRLLADCAGMSLDELTGVPAGAGQAAEGGVPVD